MCHGLDSIDFLFHLCVQSFLAFAGEKVYPAHYLQFLGYRPLRLLSSQGPVYQGGDL